ncbi:MAG TPA: hypothetical protein VI168_10190, partial [Croceibacterium sp.]
GTGKTIARYTIDAGTTSGMMAMGQGGGVGAAMSMLRGGGNNVAHDLTLRLGSTQSASQPAADHFMPAGAGLGVSVPLVTPRTPPPAEPAVPGMPQGQMPQGRLLLFWGCGEHAGPGQPVVIDFSKLARGEIPPGLFASGVDLPQAWSILQSNSTTYGDWPNARSTKTAPANASLLGAHRIAGNYSPEIAFTLADDFMPALRATGRDMPSGAVGLSWNSLAKATGYYSWAIAANPDERGQTRDMVWWTSSSTQQFGGPMSDWMSPAAVARLVEAGTVMPPSQTTCAIPAEVKQAGGPMLMTQLFAYGPQADFSFPERPANAPRGWEPEWIARVRFRANTMVMHGMPDMSGFGGEDSGSDDSAEAAAPPQQTLPRCRGLRGVAERAAGLCQ